MCINVMCKYEFEYKLESDKYGHRNLFHFHIHSKTYCGPCTSPVLVPVVGNSCFRHEQTYDDTGNNHIHMNNE